MQTPLFQPPKDWTPPSFSELPSWANAQRVGVDIETHDPLIKKLGPGVRRGAEIVGVSFAIEDGPSFYLPFGHRGGDNLPKEGVLKYLTDQAKIFKGDLVGANLQYDLDFLAEAGVEFTPRFFRDIQVAEPLLDELQNSYSLKSIAERYELPGKDEEHLREAAKVWGVDPKSGLAFLPARHVAEYAIQDAELPLRILRRQEREIENQDLWKIYDLESRVLPVLVKMRRRGVRIDFKRLGDVERWTEDEESKALKLVKDETGIHIKVGEVWKSEKLAQALYKIDVQVPLTPKTGKPSVKSDLLDGIDHPVAKALARARKVNKVRTTFAESIRAHAIGDRIHTTLNQLRKEKDDGSGLSGAAYGRLSSTDPNLQQQPARDPELGPMWRSIYIPDEGKLWAANDYSQQEPRMLIHYAEISGCRKAKEAAERYRTDPNTDHHQMMSDLTGLVRKEAKIVYLGLCYGMGGAKLCRSLGLPTEWKQIRGVWREVAGPEGQSILNQFNNEAPFVKELAKKCEARAEKVGYIITVGGRRCRFPLLPNGQGFDWTHKALNRLVQGSSADQTKTAMVEADKAGFYLQLQIHDELDSSVSSREEAEGIAGIMRNCLKLNVPSKVDVEIGPSWGEAA